MKLPLHLCLLMSLLLISCWLFAPIVNSFRISRVSSGGGAYRLAMLKNLDSVKLPMSRRKAASTTSLTFKVSDKDLEVRQKLAVVEDEDDDEDDENEVGQPSKKQVILRRLSKGVIPIAASVGFAVTPSSNVATRIAGAAAGGVAGFLAKRVIDQRLAEEQDNDSDKEEIVTIPPNIRTALSLMQKSGTSIVNYDLKRIELIAKKHNIKAADLGLFFVNVLAQAVYETVQMKSMDLTDLTELMDFIDTVGFTTSEIADGFSLAAIMVGSQLQKDKRGFFTETYPIEVLQQASKIFFLADKLIGTFEGYYGKRMLVSLSYFLPEDCQEVITEACTKLFLRCVESVLATPSSFTNDEIERLKNFITTSPMVSTFRPANMQKVITEAFLTNVNKHLEQSQGDASIGNLDKYLLAKDILGWNERELMDTIRTKTKPLFESSCRSLFDEVVSHPDRAVHLSEKLQQQMSSLQIPPSVGKEFVVDLIQSMNRDYLMQMEKVFNASNQALEPVFKIMVSYTHVHEGVKTFAQHLFTTDSETENNGVPIPELPFAGSVRLDMYQMALEKKITTGKLVIDDMFVLTEQQKRVVRKTVALPKVASWIQQIITEGQFNPDSKAAYQKLLKENHVEDDEWKATSLDFYFQEVSKIAKQRAVPSLEDMSFLQRLRDFLDCDAEQINQVHIDLFGDKYIKALEDSMNPTGIIGEEYIDGLERLRQRLGLTINDVEKLLGTALRSRLQPMMDNLNDIFKSNTDMNYRREKERKANQQEAEDNYVPKRDKSLDPISSLDNVFGFMEMEESASTPAEKKTFMREVINVVDFVAENFESQGIDIRNRDMLPINSVRMINQTDLIGMYKHFLISRLSEPKEEFRNRYLQIEPFFAKLLGVSQVDQERVKESVAYTAFTGLLRQSLMYKDRIETQDIQQFAILKEKLPISDEAAEYIYHEASVDAALAHGKQLFLENAAGSFTLTPAQARRYREQVDSMGLELREDLKFGAGLISYLYALEVQYMIENDEDNFAEVQEAYDIPEAEAMSIVEASCKRYISQQLNLALRAAKRYQETECVKWTADIMKYANYVNAKIDADGQLFTEEDKKRLISFFVAELENVQEPVEGLPEGETPASFAADKLKEMINITPDFVPPVEGIEGILGKTKSLKEMLNSSESTAQNKKRWAWG